MRNLWLRIAHRRLGEWPVNVNRSLVAHGGWAFAVSESAQRVVSIYFPSALDYRGRPGPGYETTIRDGDDGRLYVGLWKHRWRKS